MEDARPPFPWWPQLAWRLNNATGIGDDYSRRLRLRARAASGRLACAHMADMENRARPALR